MERRGLVRRQEYATDSRGQEVLLAPTDAEAFARSTVAHLCAVRELFVDALTPEQLVAAGPVTYGRRADR